MNTSNIISINKIETITTTYTSYEILEVKVIPFTSCMITVLLISDNNQRKIENLAMDSTDYANWNDDDQYLINWVNAKLMAA